MKIILLSLLGTSLSHSWLDCIGLADKQYNGPEQFFSNEFYRDYCIGFPRAYPGRMNVHVNTLFTYQVDNRGGPNHDAPVCPTQDRAYTGEFPMTQVKPGTNLKFWYEMDNHYQPLTKVHIFGYGKPDKPIVNYQELSPNTELFVHDFATTSNCINVANANTFCWAYWKVPDNWTPGVYSFLWNWRWDRNPSGEEYNSCFDIEVLPGATSPVVVPQIPTKSTSETPIQTSNPPVDPPSPKRRYKCRRKPTLFA